MDPDKGLNLLTMCRKKNRIIAYIYYQQGEGHPMDLGKMDGLTLGAFQVRQWKRIHIL